DVVALEFHPLAGHIAEDDAAVGEYPVDVETDEADAGRKLGIQLRPVSAGLGGPQTENHPRASSQMATALRITPSSCESGSMFGPSLGAWSGFGCVSRNRPSAPAAQAA